MAKCSGNVYLRIRKKSAILYEILFRLLWSNLSLKFLKKFDVKQEIYDIEISQEILKSR